jgi:hypothetical protein
MKKLLSKNLLTNEDIETVQADLYLYNELGMLSEESAEKIKQKGINCSEFRVESSWTTWNHDAQLFEKFKKKFPQLVKNGRYDFSLAILKAVYWSHFKSGQLEHVKQQYKEYQVISTEPWMHANKLNTLLKYLLNLVSNQKKGYTTPQLHFSIALLIKNSFELSLYKRLVLELKSNTSACFFVYNENLLKKICLLGVEKERVILLPFYRKSRMPILNLFKFKNTDWYILNQITRIWQELQQTKQRAEIIVQFGINKIILNEAENGLVGATYCEVFQKNGIISYNTMNGAKAGEAQDSNVNFDYWFVWDEQMKKLLHEKNKLPKDMLLVSGHLMEDEITNHTYQGSFDFIQHKNKKVISLFSVRGKREEKMEAFRFLYDLAEQKSDLVLLIRKHPSEKEEDLILPSKELPNVHWVEYNQENSKTTLYDQLSISDLSICFGSTVALESKWFGVPCITFEKREESLIYCVDDQTIFHVRNKEYFQDYTMLHFNTSKKIKANEFVCNKTATVIIDELT